jgi:AcrR family transcriptional regulator
MLHLVNRSETAKEKPMRAVDEANTEARRSTIIGAAIRCLARKGVARTSMNDICREAGMRSGHLYYYFDSKDALFAAILMYNLDAITERVEHMFEGEGDLATKIFDVHVDAEQRRSALGLTPVLRMELECYFSRGCDAVPELSSGERLIAALHKAVSRSVAAGQLPDDIDITAFSNAVSLIWLGLTHSRLFPEFDVDGYRTVVRKLLGPWVANAQSGSIGTDKRPAA